MIAHPVKTNGCAKYMITPLGDFLGDISYCVPLNITDPNYWTRIDELKTKPLSFISVRNYKQKLPVRHIVNNAINFVNDHREYCLLTNNCEMFAEYCVTGKMPAVSNQVIDVIKKYDSIDRILNINKIISDGLFSLLYDTM
jgi:hypothetical protein